MIRTLLFILTIALITPAHAADNIEIQIRDYTAFETMPVLDNGRIKPLGAFAKARLKDFHGKDTNATQWLAQTLFNPSEAVNARIFHIKDDALKTRLSLDTSNDYFNLDDLQKGLQDTQKDIIVLLQTNQSDLTRQQKALLKIHEDAVSYNELLRSFSLILPLQGGNTFIDILPKEQSIIADLKSIIAQKGEDINAYTDQEQNTATLGFQLQQIRAGAIENDDFKVIPVTLNNELSWVSPWQTINDGQGSPQTAELLSLWQKTANSYRNNNAKAWQENTQELLAKTKSIAGPSISENRLKIELIYQALQPYSIAMALYAFAIIILSIGLLKPSPLINAAALTSITLASITHAGAIAARIYILDRPPVGTLYESVLFVSLICAIIGLITFAKSRKTMLPLTSQIAALGLLAIAPTMLQKNDSLELLVAVLNTNFWLATHVLCITAGYGVCIIAACLSHAYMMLRLKNPSHHLLDGMLQSIHKIGLIALLLTAVGTVLGGIWADQSWGRFWGWDPKENGALLIVLWLIWIQHGRLSGHIRPLAYVAGMAALNIVVALAWFGVNLLGVGLHSYGFTSGIASGLAAFCITETLLIITLWTLTRKQQSKHGASP